MKRGQGGGKNIYFYPTVHFCQLPLPPNSVVLVHDLTPLVLRKLMILSIGNEFIYLH